MQQSRDRSVLFLSLVQFGYRLLLLIVVRGLFLGLGGQIFHS